MQEAIPSIVDLFLQAMEQLCNFMLALSSEEVQNLEFLAFAA
jgi:hypothetical protein